MSYGCGECNFIGYVEIGSHVLVKEHTITKIKLADREVHVELLHGEEVILYKTDLAAADAYHELVKLLV